MNFSPKTRRIGSGLLVATAALILVRSLTSPVILRFKDPSAVDPADGFYVLFSSLRNHAPELEASLLLTALKQGECGNGVAVVARPYCEQERKYPLSGWKLVDRRNNPDRSVSLHYKVFRGVHPPDVWGNAWVTVQATQNGWEPTNYDTYY